MSTKTRKSAPVTREDFAKLNDGDLLRAAIAGTRDKRPGHDGEPMPAIVFATDVAMCNPRTLRRYLALERDLPKLLREKCIDLAVAGAKRAARETANA